MPVGVKQHLVALQQIGADQEGPAVRELDVGNLQFGALAAEHRVVLAPVKLKGITWAEGQGNKGSAIRGLLLALPINPPLPGKGSDPVVGALVAKPDQICVQLLQCPALLAGFCSLGLQPGCELVGERVELARPIRHCELRLDRASLQILLDGVPGQSGPTRNLADRQLLPKSQPADDIQKSHVDHSAVPRRSMHAGRVTWVKSQRKSGANSGQFQVEINRRMAGRKSVGMIQPPPSNPPDFGPTPTDNHTDRAACR